MTGLTPDVNIHHDGETPQVIDNELLKESLTHIEQVQKSRLLSFMVDSGFTHNDDSNVQPTVILPKYYQELEEITAWIHGSFDRGILETLAVKLKNTPDQYPTDPFGTAHEENDVDDILDYLKKQYPNKYREIVDSSFDRFGFEIREDIFTSNKARTQIVIDAVVNSALIIDSIKYALERDHDFYGPHLHDSDFQPIVEELGSKFDLFTYKVLWQHDLIKAFYDRLKQTASGISGDTLEVVNKAKEALAMVDFRSEVNELSTTAELRREIFQTQDRYLAFIRHFRTKDDYSVLLPRDQLAEGLPPELLGLSGVEQYGVHGDYDALQHSLRVCEQLEAGDHTRGLDPYQAEVIRVAALLHDLGKVENAQNVNHAHFSVEYALTVLNHMGYEDGDPMIGDIIKLIRNHDQLGFFARPDFDDGVYDVVNAYVPNTNSPLNQEQLLELGRRLFIADVTTIPGTFTNGESFATAVLTQLKQESWPAVKAEIDRMRADVETVQEFKPLEVRSPWHLRFWRKNAAWGAILKLAKEDTQPVDRRDALETLISTFIRANPEHMEQAAIKHGKYVGVLLEAFFEDSTARFNAQQNISKYTVTMIRAILEENREVIADSLLERIELNIPRELKYHSQIMSIREARALIRSGSSKAIPDFAHGTSSRIIAAGLPQFGGLVSAREIAERSPQHAIGGEGAIYKWKNANPSRRISLSNLPPAIVYAHLNTERFAYSIEPISARKRLLAEVQLFERRIHNAQQTLDATPDIFVDNPATILNMGPSELRTYLGQLSETYTQLSSLGPLAHLPDISQLISRLQTFHQVERLGARTHQQEQRNLIKQYPIVFGVRRQKGQKVHARNTSTILNESWIASLIPLSDISHVFVPYNQRQRVQAVFKTLATDIDGNPEFSRLAATIVSLDALRIIESLRTGGESEERLRTLNKILKIGILKRREGSEIDRKH